MKTTLITLLVITGLTSCVSNKLVTSKPVTKTTSNKVVVLPYEDYIYDGVKLMNGSDTLYLNK
jgi:hypothetical protein